MKRFTGYLILIRGFKLYLLISPVRHIRDGVIENNRSKARLIEVAHQLVNKFNRTYYFPAYELVIDVLRDYRFYDKDLVHPNYMATNYVVENFMEYYVHPESRLLSEEIRKLQISRKAQAASSEYRRPPSFSEGATRKNDWNCRTSILF